MSSIDLSARLEKTQASIKKEERKTPARFAPREERRKEKAPLQEEMTDVLKQFLNQQKGGEIASVSPPPVFTSPLSSSSPVSWQPSAQITALFEKMTNLLTHMDDKGIKTTTIVLDGEVFSSSAFAGSQLTITEYSTAPKVFNISLAATPEALAFFAPHAQQLQTALKEGKWDFTIERFETELLDGKPRKKR